MIEDSTVERIRDAALECFCRHGYEGTSLREIGREAGVSVAGIYHYFRTKSDLLYELIDSTHDAVIAQTEAAVALAGDDPAARLRAAVWSHCDYHTRFRRESFIGNTELRSLAADRRARIVAKRDRQKLVFRDILVDGAERGLFDVADPVSVGRALLMMCTGIATWYRPDGPEAPRQIAEDYCQLAARLVGAPVPATRRVVAA